MRVARLVSSSVIALALTASLLVLSACSSANEDTGYSVVQEGTLTVAASVSNAPYEQSDGQNVTGYSIAVVQEIANRLGLACSVQLTESGQVMSVIAEGSQVDVGVGGLVINAENSRIVDFTTPYYYADQALVAVAGTFESAEEVKGVSVAAVEDSTAADYAEYTLGAEVVTRANAASCFEALRAGTVQAVAVDYQVARSYLAGAYSDCEVIERYVNGEKISIAVNQSNDMLKDAINEVIAAMEADGTLESLQDQYLY